MTNRAWTIAAVVAASGATLIGIALFGLQVGILFSDIALKSGTPLSAGTFRQLVDASSSLSPLRILAELAAAALFIAWMNRTYRKLPELGALELKGSPGGAVGWWFVPLANLYVPYQYLREIWRAVTPGLMPNTLISRATVSGGRIVGALWILAIFEFPLPFLARGLGQGAVSIDDFIRYRAINVTLLASRVGYLLLTIALMLAVQIRQAKRFAELQSAAAGTG